MEELELRKIIDSLKQEAPTIEENNRIEADVGYTSDGRLVIGISFPKNLSRDQLERMIQELKKLELLDDIREYKDRIILELRNGKEIRCYKYISEDKYTCRH